MSLFGKILALLNIFGACGLVVCAMLDYGKRQTWAYSYYRHELVFNGLPLSPEERDAENHPLVDRLGEELSSEIFKDLGGNPVVTQVQEVERIKTILDAKIEAGQSKSAQAYTLARILLPLADNYRESNTEAVTDFTNKKIAAPVPAIQFQKIEDSTGSLLSFIAAKTNSNTYEAAEALDHFCDKLKKEIETSSVAKLHGVGNFFINTYGEIKFLQEELPPFYLPPVRAERVIHPEAEHNILVGDKETTNTAMTDYFNEEPVEKDRWWIWAIILGVIGLGAILIYFSDSNSSSLFGNAIKI